MNWKIKIYDKFQDSYMDQKWNSKFTKHTVNNSQAARKHLNHLNFVRCYCKFSRALILLCNKCKQDKVPHSVSYAKQVLMYICAQR